jgi:hypothetical protein
MKVKDLIKQLSVLDDDLDVIMSSDSEGNMYSPLIDVVPGIFYVPISNSYGELYYHSELDDNLIKEGYTEDDVAPSDAIQSVVLYPIR